MGPEPIPLIRAKGPRSQIMARVLEDEALHLEVILQRELNLTHARPGRGDLAKGRLRRCVRTAPANIWITQLHVIRSVEHLHAELQSLILGDLEILDSREVEVYLSWRNQVVARTGSEEWSDSIGERSRVIPGFGSGVWENRIRAGHAIKPVTE